MAISTKLELRQRHSLVMTPQLQQAIKLLQLSNMELAAFVDAELERNPLLEREESEEPASAPNGEAPEPVSSPFKDGDRDEANAAAAEPAKDTAEADVPDGDDGDWLDLQAESSGRQADDLDTEPQDTLLDADNFGPGALKDFRLDCACPRSAP